MEAQSCSPPHKEPTRWFTRKEKGKQKMLKYDSDKGDSDWSISDSNESKNEPRRKRSKSVEKAKKSAN